MPARPHLRWPDEADHDPVAPATAPPRHWRLRELVRSRPLPLAALLAAGLGPLAWALHSAAVAPLAVVTPPGGWLRDSASAVSPRAPQWGDPLPAGSATAEAAEPAPAAAAPAPPAAPAQWGEPLPQYRAEFVVREAIASGLIQPPDTMRRRSGSVVLASEYFRQHGPETAPPDPVLAQASPRTGSRMRLDVSWRGTRELVDAVSPMVAVAPPAAGATGGVAGMAAAAPAGPAAGPARALRIAELPDAVGLPHTLAVDDGSTMPPAGIEPFTLQKAIDKGLARSPLVQAAQARRDSFRHEQRAAFGTLLPQADARAAFGTGRSDTLGTSQRERRDAQFTVRQTLLDLAANREVDRSKALAVAAELHWQATVSDLSADIATAYLQLLQARIASALAQRQERQLSRLLAQLVERGGTDAQATVERNRLQARVAQARSQVANAQQTLQASLTHLASLTGEAPQVLALALPASLAIPGSAAAAREEAGRQNRELLASRSEAVAIAYEALGHRARMLPKVQAELTHTRQTNLGTAPGETRDTRGMLVLNWQLYNGGTDLARQRAAQSREQAQGLRSDELKRRIDQDLTIAYDALGRVGPRFAGLRDELIAHAGVVSALEHQALAGQRPMIDVLDAYQRLHAARMEITGLVLGEVLSTLRVAQHTGRLGAYATQDVR
jgi:adhesin transport system outer membrane protein